MIKFFKYNSNGNDFIILDDRDQKFDYLSKNPQIIKKLCTRQFFIGADGLILLQKSLVANYKMRIFNSDGTEAFMCGNGLLSLIKFIYEFIDKNSSNLIETKVGIYNTFVDENSSSFKSKYPKVLKENIKVYVDDIEYDLQMLNSGVFHGVIYSKNIDKIDVFKIGRKIRYLKIFEPSGINVNFCEMVDKKKIKVRTYEKGVENETFCCSTAALAVSYNYFLKNKNIKNLILQYKGGEIKVFFEKNEIELISKPVFAYEGYFNESLK